MYQYTRMIPKSSLRSLKDYSFHSGAPTALDSIFCRYWWTPVVKFMPKWLSPNVITLTGAACMALIYYFIFTRIPGLESTRAPHWMPLLVSLMMFLYMTFDGVDGKQARRLGVSSPLGQLLDHGVDAVVTTFYPYLCFTIFPGGFTYPMVLLTAVACLHVLCTIWRESEFDTFSYTSGVVGVTEANLMVILLQLFYYYFGPKAFRRVVFTFSKQSMSGFLGKVFPRNVDVFTAIQYSILACSYAEISCGLYQLYRKSRRRNSYLVFVLSSLLHVYGAALLAYRVPASSKVLGCLFAATLGAIMCVNNIVCILCKVRLRPYHLSLAPYYLLLAQSLGVAFLKSQGYNVKSLVLPPAKFHSLLQKVVLYGFAYIAFVFGKTIREIMDYLGIPLLTVKARRFSK